MENNMNVVRACIAYYDLNDDFEQELSDCGIFYGYAEGYICICGTEEWVKEFILIAKRDYGLVPVKTKSFDCDMTGIKLD